jgi:hypothetical protein
MFEAVLARPAGEGRNVSEAANPVEGSGLPAGPAAGPRPEDIPAAGRPARPGLLGGILRGVGPGLITGAADDDPCAVGTYSLAGASFGTGVLWLAPVTLPMMSAVVYLAAKIGMVSGRGLAGAIRERYGRPILYPVVLATYRTSTPSAPCYGPRSCRGCWRRRCWCS